MFIVVSADKDRNDRPIMIYKEKVFRTEERATEYMKEVLVDLVRHTSTLDEEAMNLSEYNYDFDKYELELKERILNRINKTIKDGESCIETSEYDSIQIGTHGNNLHLITTGCPSHNEYIGETWKVLEL